MRRLKLDLNTIVNGCLTPENIKKPEHTTAWEKKVHLKILFGKGLVLEKRSAAGW